MDSRDRDAIEQLFERIARVEQKSGPRDRAAEALIQSQIAVQPSAPYYMAQTILVQEDALRAAQERIAELERLTAGEPDGGGVLGGIFGGVRPMGRGAGQRPRLDPWAEPRGMGGGGFLAGAAQTALGVTGGVLLGNLLADWFAPDQAAAAEESSLFDNLDSEPEVQPGDSGDFGADFDLGDF